MQTRNSRVLCLEISLYDVSKISSVGRTPTCTEADLLIDKRAV